MAFSANTCLPAILLPSFLCSQTWTVLAIVPPALQRCTLPPHSATPWPAADSVVLAYEPDGSYELMASEQPAASCGAAPAAPYPADKLIPADTAAAASTAAHSNPTGAFTSSTTRPAGTSRLPGGAAGQGGSVVDEDDEDMDPRTLEQAVARLAKYTTDKPADKPAAFPWTDVYKVRLHSALYDKAGSVHDWRYVYVASIAMEIVLLWLLSY